MIPFRSLILAPMVGISNRAFRTLIQEIGPADYCFTEMASAEAFISGAQYEDCYTDPLPCPEATSIQFSARSPEALGKACSMVAARPAGSRPAGIDINFGCSAPHIRRAGGGSAWSDKPEGAADLVAAARASWPGTLSAKIRMGSDADPVRLRSFCETIAAGGLDFITLHPRMNNQKLRRKPDYDSIGGIAKDLPLPLVGNGDIHDPASLAEVLDGQKAYAAMIGREAVRRPWIFRLLRSTAPGQDNGTVDRLEIALRFLELDEALLPAPWRLESARRFLSYYCDTLSFAHHIKYKAMNSPDIESMRSTLRDYFEQVPADRELSI
jgi:tRNA-dihydrouridine synthase